MRKFGSDFETSKLAEAFNVINFLLIPSLISTNFEMSFFVGDLYRIRLNLRPFLLQVDLISVSFRLFLLDVVPFGSTAFEV